MFSGSLPSSRGRARSFVPRTALLAISSMRDISIVINSTFLPAAASVSAICSIREVLPMLETAPSTVSPACRPPSNALSKPAIPVDITAAQPRRSRYARNSSSKVGCCCTPCGAMAASQAACSASLFFTNASFTSLQPSGKASTAHAMPRAVSCSRSFPFIPCPAASESPARIIFSGHATGTYSSIFCTSFPVLAAPQRATAGNPNSSKERASKMPSVTNSAFPAARSIAALFQSGIAPRLFW